MHLYATTALALVAPVSLAQGAAAQTSPPSQAGAPTASPTTQAPGPTTPGFHFVPPDPVLVADWQKGRSTREFRGSITEFSKDNSSAGAGTGGATITASATRAAGTVAPEVPTDIATLARALKNDPDLIYQFVRDNIELYPVFGIHKGAVGALIDRQGSDADQAELMAYLLRASGYQVSVVKGLVVLTKDQIHSYYGVNTASDCALQNFFAAGRIPVDRFLCTTPDTSLGFLHFWVRVTIGNQTYDFDPSLKAHTIKTGIDLRGATGYSQTTFMADADSGATITSNTARNLNRTNARTDLTNYSNNLIAYIRANSPAASLDDIVGGKTITPPQNRIESPTRQSRLPYEANYPEQVWTGEIPNNLRSVLQLTTGNVTVNLVSDKFYGSRLTFNTDATSNLQLLADGQVIATFNQLAAGATQPLTVRIIHSAYPDSSADDSFTKTIVGGEPLIITMGFGPATRQLGQRYRNGIAAAKNAGAVEGSEPIVAGGLSTIGADIQAQLAMTTNLTDRIGGVNTVVHHFVGTVSEHDGGPVTDLRSIYMTTIQQDNNVSIGTADFISNTMHASAFESGVLEQIFQTGAASTVRLIDDAIAGGETIYSATSSNFTSEVQPNLLNCSPSEISTLSSYANSFRVVLPQNCARAVDLWKGLGYLLVNPNPSNLSVGMMIDGGYNGGYLGIRQTLNSSQFKKKHPWLAWWNEPHADPVDMTTGNFMYSHDDLVVGEPSFPDGLGMQKTYSSGARDFDGPLGPGWSHNLAMRLDQTTDAFQGLGEDSPIDAATSIAETLVSLDLLSDPNLPLDKVATSVMAQRWFADQLNNNAIALSSDVQGQFFVKLPDGSYNPPPANSSKLTKNADGSFTQSLVDKSTFEFDTSGNLTAWKSPNGFQTQFSYVNGQLSGVRNSVGRSLSLTYTSTHITSVQDGTGRSVGYGYDANGNLTSFTDTNGRVTTFEYDQPGRISKFYLPANPTIAQVSNTYDILGRVQQQTDADGKLWQMFVAGTRSELVSPLGNRLVDYYDSNGRVLATLKDVNPPTGNSYWAPRETDFLYDGLERLTQMTDSVGPMLQLTYDDASCNSTEKRCTNNVKTRLQRAVHSAGDTTTLPDDVQSFNYESQFNKVLTAQNGLGKITNFGYDAAGNLTSVMQPPPVDGGTLRPTTTVGYTTFAAAPGFPNFSLLTSVTKNIDASNNVTEQLTYDASNGFELKTRVLDSGGLNLTTAYGYDPVGNLTSIDGPRTDVSDITAFAYDAERRQISATDALGKVKQTNYNADGDVSSVAAQLGTQWVATCYTRGPSGKISEIVGPSNVTTANACPSPSAPNSVTDLAYDDDGRILTNTVNLASLEGGSRVTRYGYTPDGDRISASRAVGTPLEQVSLRGRRLYTGTWASMGWYSPRATGDVSNTAPTISTQFNAHNRPTETDFRIGSLSNAIGCPATTSGYGCEQYAYDAIGDLTSWTRRDGQILTFSYDNLGRIVQRTAPNASDGMTYTYDLLGRMLSATYGGRGGASLTNSYDHVGRLLSSTSGGRTINYQYDAAGNRTRVTWPDTAFYITYDFDALNRGSAIKEKGTTLLASFSYDDLSRLTTASYSNGTSISYGFDNQARLASQSYDLAGTTSDLTRTFTRDQAGEVTGLTTTNPAYDWNGHYNINRPYTTDAEERYLTSGTKSLSYDNRGNLAGDGTWTFTYDVFNRLTSAVAKGAASLTYTYDPIDRLSSKTSGRNTSNFLYAGDQVMGEYDASGALIRRYVPGMTGDAIVIYDGTNVATKTWLYPDPQGSITATADASGNSISILSYGPFGEPNTNAGVSLRYTGQFLDTDSGLYYYRARWYSPYLARFLSPDPALLIDGLQTYKYVDNDPINYSDPSGLIRQLGKDALKLLPKHCGGTASQHPFLKKVALAADVTNVVATGLSPFVPQAGLVQRGSGVVSKGIDGYFATEAAYHFVQGNNADAINYGFSAAETAFLKGAFRKFWPMPARQLRKPNGQYSSETTKSAAAEPLASASSNVMGEVCP